MTTNAFPRGEREPLPASVPIEGAALKALRAYEGSAQADLADRLGISQQTVAVWERKGVPYANRDRVRKLLGEAELVWAQLRADGELGGDLSPEQFAAQFYWAEVEPRPQVYRVPAWPSDEAQAKLLASFSEIELLDELRRRADARGTTL
ncbi:hypothetical protein C5B85_10785 [Pseudoclavibacter sp. AY1F1]|uniref:helix-turn-helix domain-containing protein n=1 Tax=Pseudoclavibacter sp. AY1F1 TaxID=2080583 RepID=UPI000CE80711|nr:helix-turn-helix domain-containing protein [Pseudoclavibacter sp. AY1F1]PPF44123.1 hypothetical protein C5B85_10785 [Pseudoclavibacter sp. AY1F1]